MEPANRKKKFHHKTRNGCITCRKRRLKCDETKPECLRCQKSEEKCLYATTRTWNFDPIPGQSHAISQSTDPRLFSHQQDGQSSSTRTNLALVRNSKTPLFVPVTFDIQSTSEERRCFHLFLQTGPSVFEACDPVDLDLLNRTLPQACWSIPPLRQLLTAFSFWLQSQLDPVNSRSHRGSAEQYYNKAIRMLAKPDGFMNNADPVEVLMLLLFLRCMECYRNDVDRATMHFKAAMNLIQEKNLHGLPNKLNNTLQSVIDRMRARWMAATGNLLVSANPQSNEPHQMNYALNDLNDVILQVCAYFANIQPQPDESSLYIPTTCIQLLDQWNFDLQAYLASGHEPNANTIYAQIQYNIARMVLLTIVHASSTKYDEFDETFRDILSLAHAFSIWNDRSNSNALRSGQIKLVFGLELIISVFLVAYECRNPTIRRSAISFLRQFRRREMGWDSFHAALIAEWIMKREEEDAQTLGYEIIPAAFRIQLQSLKFYRRESEPGDTFKAPSMAIIQYKYLDKNFEELLYVETEELPNMFFEPANVAKTMSLCFTISAPFIPSPAILIHRAYEKIMAKFGTELRTTSPTIFDSLPLRTTR